MIKWKNIKTSIPNEYESVLVCTNLYDDDWKDFFVASYFEGENEWIQNLSFQPEKSPYVTITRKALDGDRWCRINYNEMD